MAILNNTRIVAPVNLSEVRQVMVEASHDLATICKSNKINKWSKYKPISANKIGQVTAQEYAGKQYGLVLPTGLRTNAKITWGYNKPYGGVTSPYRLTDFLGYEHNAPQTISFVTSLDEENAKNGLIPTDVDDFSVYAICNQDSTAGGILPSELQSPYLESNLSTYYFGYAFVNTNNQIVFMGTSATPIGNNTQLNVGVSALSDLDEGEYKVVFFLCDTEVAPQANPTTLPQRYVTLENALFNVYLVNYQQYYGWILYSSYRASNGGANRTSANNSIKLTQTASVGSYVIEGTNIPDIRRRLSVKNTNINQHFSNFDPSSRKYSFILTIMGHDNSNIYDGVIVGILYRYLGYTESGHDSIGYTRVYKWYKEVVVIAGDAIISPLNGSDVANVTYTASSLYNYESGTLAYTSNSRIKEVYLSNVVRTGGSTQDYAGIQVAWKLENDRIYGMEINDANACIQAESDYAVYVGDCDFLRYDASIDLDGHENATFINGAEAEACNIDYELLNPVTLTNN